MKFLLGLGLAAFLLPGLAPAAAPDWFSDFEKTVGGCGSKDLCVAGEGSSLSEALGMGRSEAAKFFQTRVESKTQVNVQSSQKDLFNATVDEWSNKSLSEETSEILSGLEIKKQEAKDGRTYVVMGLDKNATAKELRDRILNLDVVNAKAFGQGSRFSYPKILNNLSVADALINRLRLIGPEPMKLQVSREQVLERVNRLKPLKLSMVTKGRKLPTKLSHTLIDLLSPLRIILVPIKASPKYSLVSEIIVEDQYFKVEGFKKLNVNLRMELQNSQKTILGKISALSEQVARNNDQAIEKAAPELRDYLIEHLDELSTLKLED